MSGSKARIQSHIYLIVFFLFLLQSYKGLAQVSMGNDVNFYSQDFDGLPASGNAIWESGKFYFPGWTVQRTVAGNTIEANNGSSSTGALYSYGTNSSFDRALGSVSTGPGGEFAYGLLLQNTTGETITELDISFIGEQWRIGEISAGEQKLTFWYAIRSDLNFNLSPTSDNGWTSIKSLDFSSPIFLTTGGNLDGNLAANRRLLSHTLKMDIPAGHFIMLRWKDIDDLHRDHGLAVDNFTLTWRKATKPAGVLPVELLKFSAHLNSNYVKLSWETASESNNDYYAIERSADGKEFYEISSVKGNGTTSQLSKYTFIDVSPLSKTSFYRLKQVDIDGSFEYSSVISVSVPVGKDAYIIYPTNASNLVEIEVQPGSVLNKVSVLNSTGKNIMEVLVNPSEKLILLNISSLSSGIYIMRLQGADGEIVTKRFYKI